MGRSQPGSIDPPEAAARWAWAKQELGLYPHHRRMFAQKNNGWNAALSIPGRRIAWVSRRMPHEFCGFLEWLWRLGDEPCEIVDLHDVKFDGTIRREPVPSLSSILPEHIRDNAFWDLAQPPAGAGRLHKLVEAGILEAAGNVAQMRFSEVRRREDVEAAG